MRRSVLKQKKLIVSLVVILIFSLSAVSALSSDRRIVEIYKNIERMSKKTTPDYYKVRVENQKFSEALKELPEDIVIGNKKPYVVIVFKRGEGVKIIIENIKSEYTSLFSMYEDYFKFSGISKVQNPIEFKEIMDKNKIDFYKEDGDYVIVKAWDPEKEEKGDDYALFYLDKSKWIIRKAVYYLQYIISEEVPISRR